MLYVLSRKKTPVVGFKLNVVSSDTQAGKYTSVHLVFQYYKVTFSCNVFKVFKNNFKIEIKMKKIK